MAEFRGQIQDSVRMAVPGVVLSLAHVEGLPHVGMRVQIGSVVTTVLDIGKKSPEGPVVFDRNCLTGQPCAPHATILVDDVGIVAERGQWVEEDRTK